MDYKFSLHAGEIGSYDWGSMLIRFASLAKISARSAVEIMAGAIAGNAVWKSGAEFRGYIALLHEYVHYIQDMYTGLGHWDYLIRREHTPILLGHARLFSWLAGKDPPYSSAELRSHASPEFLEYLRAYEIDRERVQDKLAYIPFGDASRKRSESVLSYMRSLNAHVPVGPGDEAPFILESLLEAEAAATSFIQLHDLKMSDEQWDIARDHKSLFSLGAMAEVYSGTIRNVLQVLEHVFDTPVDEDSTWGELVRQLTTHLTVFLVDLACAYPSPDQLQSDKKKEEYEPGIRFIRLLRAFQDLAGKKAINDFIDALFKKKYEKAETYLLQECEFPYDPAIDIYKRWLVYYEENEKSAEDPVLMFRKTCLEQRSQNFDAYVFKTPFLIMERTHLYWIKATGIESIGSSADYFNLEAKKQYFRNFLTQNRDWATVNFFLGSGRFVCPLAEARLCDFATPLCLSGLQKTEQFPPAPGCEIRAGLEEAQFSLNSYRHSE